MQTKLNPYISFKDNARQAMTFYQTVFGGKLTMNTFREFNAVDNPAEADLLMHASLETDNGLTLMGADTPSRMEYKPGTNFSVSLSGDNEAELSGYFHKLAQGGFVAQPLEKAMWGDSFGMLTDQFGVNWMVNIVAPRS